MDLTFDPRDRPCSTRVPVTEMDLLGEGDLSSRLHTPLIPCPRTPEPLGAVGLEEEETPYRGSYASLVPGPASQESQRDGSRSSSPDSWVSESPEHNNIRKHTPYSRLGYINKVERRAHVMLGIIFLDSKKHLHLNPAVKSCEI